uniref:Uncharacterized protein n=1 Tax=Oryzias sinensis TaxID=183150 RepID=A0A8C7Z5U6_9TELE
WSPSIQEASPPPGELSRRTQSPRRPLGGVTIRVQPRWKRMCRFKLPCCVNSCPQTPQPKGFSPVCTVMCEFRLVLRLNLLPQTSQPKGRSPLWTIMCVFRLFWCRALLPQMSQTKGFSPVWMRMCVFRLCWCLKRLPHTSQPNGSSPVWMRMWIFRLFSRSRRRRTSSSRCELWAAARRSAAAQAVWR